MRKGTMRKFSILFSMVVICSLVLMAPASAASTTKNLATNFTLINLGTTPANVSLNYLKPDGSPWTGSSFTSLIIPGDGGQAIVRQYSDTLTAGQGSVVISSDQALGSMVQIQNRSGVGAPTSAAYTGFSSGSGTVYLPMLARKASTATGQSNSQIFIQNTGSSATTASIQLKGLFTVFSYTVPAITIQPGATALYDLNDELPANVPDNWWGSAVVTAGVGGQIAAVSNWFFGADGLNTYEGVPIESITNKWFIPVIYIKLPNTLNSSITVQNVSGAQMAINDLTMTCKKDPASPSTDGATLTFHNDTTIDDSKTYNWNLSLGTFPQSSWWGGCVISSLTSKNFITLVQNRYINKADQGGYIALPGTSTDKTLYDPLIAKVLANNFATEFFIQNLNETTDAHVNLYYIPSTDIPGLPTITRLNVLIPAGGSIQRNFRGTGTALSESPEMPTGWYGSLKVTSDQPIQALLSNSYTTVSGDQYMAYTAFTKP